MNEQNRGAECPSAMHLGPTLTHTFQLLRAPRPRTTVPTPSSCIASAAGLTNADPTELPRVTKQEHSVHICTSSGAAPPPVPAAHDYVAIVAGVSSLWRSSGRPHGFSLFPAGWRYDTDSGEQALARKGTATMPSSVTLMPSLLLLSRSVRGGGISVSRFGPVARRRGGC